MAENLFFNGTSMFKASRSRGQHLLMGAPEHTNDSIFTQIPPECCENEDLSCCLDVTERTASAKGVMPQKKTPFGWRFSDVFHQNPSCCDPEDEQSPGSPGPN
jgi:hypothetical protein